MTDGISQLDVWNKFILDGNLDALSQIYFHHYDFLFDYGLRHISDRQLVEDVIQNVFFNLIKLRKGIGIVKNLNGYLLSAFRRELFLDINKRKKIFLTESFSDENFEFFKSHEPDISDNENMEQLYSIIRNCVEKLNDRQREIIFLRFEREISYEEIALTLHISVDSCYKSIYRSIKIIRYEAEKILRNQQINIM